MADTKGTTSYDVFRAELQSVFGAFDPSDDSWIQEIFNASQKQIADGINVGSIPDLLVNDKTLTRYRSRFAGLIKLQELSKTSTITHVPSVAEYMATERSMTSILKRYGLNDMADISNIADIIGNDVSATELEQRVVEGYLAVKNADTGLREQLQKEFPGLGESDFVHALLSKPGEGPEVLKKKVARAGINASAQSAGIVSQIGANELVAQNVSREQALAGFQAVSEAKSGLEAAASTYRENVSTKDLQKEAEEMALLGKTSQRVKGLASQARSEFAGTTGVVSGSLKKRKSSNL